MTYRTNFQAAGNSNNQKPVFLIRMIWVIKHNGSIIIKHGFRLFKRDMVLGLINGIFSFVPLEFYLVHNYIIIITLHLSTDNKPPAHTAPGGKIQVLGFELSPDGEKPCGLDGQGI